MLPRPPCSPLFPYTTLFRSLHAGSVGNCEGVLRCARIGRSDGADVAVRPRLRADPPGRIEPVVGIVADREPAPFGVRSEEHTSELQSRLHLVCRLLLEKKKK